MRGLLLITLAVFVSACSADMYVNRQAYSIEESEKISNTDNNNIKVHLDDGRLVMYDSWLIDKQKDIIVGRGIVYNIRRDSKSSEYIQGLQFPLNKVVLIETNEYTGSNVGSPLVMVLVGLTQTIPALICLTDPKSCFGSCPTFYLFKDDSLLIQAEGFSSSISKSLEDSDIDILIDYEGESPFVKLELKNEALETHYIRYANLLAVPEFKKGLVLPTSNGILFQVEKMTSPVASTLGELDFEKIRKMDDKEFISKSDAGDLMKKEEIILEFDNVEITNGGIIIRSRQTLLTTYLFYQSLAYMGSSYGYIMAQYERSNSLVKKMQKDMYDKLGGIEVFVKKGSRWILLDNLDERGPIAKDIHLIQVPSKFRSIDQIKIRMTKGLWKVDYVGLGEIVDEVYPVEIMPEKVFESGTLNEDVRNSLIDKGSYLVTDPGTSYTLEYKLPIGGPFQLFLESKGYYIEWMRQEWLKEEDPEMVRLMIRNPKAYLKQLAPDYKRREDEMENIFWNSKFGKIQF